MLWQVLHEVEAANGPRELNELSRCLGVERSALDGMIQFWVRKGRLIDNAAAAEDVVCAVEKCHRGCGSDQGCPFTMQLPRTFSIKLHDSDHDS